MHTYRKEWERKYEKRPTRRRFKTWFKDSRCSGSKLVNDWNFSFDFVMSHVEERNHENTIFVGDLDQSVDEALLWELMIQVGPVGTISFPDPLNLSFLCMDNFPKCNKQV